MQELFRTLKGHNQHVDAESVASTLAIVAQHLDTLHPEKKGLFGALSKRLTDQLEALRAQRDTAFSFFAGQGPVAKKLRDHVNMQRWILGENHFGLGLKLREVESLFDLHPTKDETVLESLTAFIRSTFPLMNGTHIDGQEFTEVTGDQTLMNLSSGFYVDRRGTVPAYMLLLRTRIANTGPEVLYVLQACREEQLFFYHPNEDEWFRADYTFTFYQLVNKLKAELDIVIEPLGFTVTPLNLELELAKLYDRVNFIFDNEERLSAARHEYYREGQDWTQILLPLGAGYSWMFTNTKGRYPSRSNAFVKKIGESIQSASIDELNEFSRQNMFKFAFGELDKMANSIMSEEAALADTA
jgi:hypothetical protein